MYFTFSIILKYVTGQYCAFASTWFFSYSISEFIKITICLSKTFCIFVIFNNPLFDFVLFVFVFVINGLLQIFLSFVLNLLSVLYFCFTIPFTLLITPCSSR